MRFRFTGLVGSTRRWGQNVKQSGIFRSLKQAALGVVSIAFTILGMATAVLASSANDRFMGIACAVFFGGGYATMLLIRSANRGPRAALSVPLRIDKHSRKQIDRLELHVAPRQIIIYVSATLIFLAGAAVLFVQMGGIIGSVVGLAALGLAVCGLLGAAALVVNRRPPIVLDLESLTYRHPLRQPIQVRYRDIAALTIYAVSSQRFVIIKPYNVEAALADATPRQRRALESALHWFGAPYVLPTTVVPNAEQLVNLISTYMDADRRPDSIEPRNSDEEQRLTSLPAAADPKPSTSSAKPPDEKFYTM